MKWISPYTVMLTINMEPVYGIVLALIILGESENMGPQFYYGAAIIILTVVANGIIKNRIKKKSKNSKNMHGAQSAYLKNFFKISLKFLLKIVFKKFLVEIE